MEKDYRSRLERLEHVSRKAEAKATNIAKARDTLATQLSFAVYGLVAADYWRLLIPQSAVALVPYRGKQLHVMPESSPTKNYVAEDLSVMESTPQKCINIVSVCPPVVSDVSVQTCYKCPVASSDAPMRKEVHSFGVQSLSNSTLKDQLTLEEHGQRRSAERNEDEPVSKRPRSISTRNQATMTDKAVSVTEREQFYLEQIEALQKEKISLRKVCYEYSMYIYAILILVTIK